VVILLDNLAIPQVSPDTRPQLSLATRPLREHREPTRQEEPTRPSQATLPLLVPIHPRRGVTPHKLGGIRPLLGATRLLLGATHLLLGAIRPGLLTLTLLLDLLLVLQDMTEPDPLEWYPRQDTLHELVILLELLLWQSLTDRDTRRTGLCQLGTWGTLGEV